jgi:glycosyltransferase involved in cell wall biosynthesis
MKIAFNAFSTKACSGSRKITKELSTEFERKLIVISGINITKGGPLSILSDCLSFLESSLANKYKIIALVNRKSLFNNLKKIKLIEFPNSTKSYIHKLYYEYLYFYFLSKKLKPYLWLSMNDVSPNVEAQKRAVYCHNSSPFYNISLKEILLDPKFFIFNKFYSLLYTINIRKNDFVIVQQDWLRNEFISRFKLDPTKVIVAYPIFKNDTSDNTSFINIKESRLKRFIYPALPRVFKNFELICEASKILLEKGVNNFEVILTIDGSENRYSKLIKNKYGSIRNIKFIGLQSRDKVFELYKISDCLIFPSKLETWGLPISEFKQFGKPILAADLPYARETVGNYDMVCFFNPYNPYELANLMENIIYNRLVFQSNKVPQPKYPFAQSWKDLFDIILGEESHNE